jgi:hypothetical protein
LDSIATPNVIVHASARPMMWRCSSPVRRSRRRRIVTILSPVRRNRSAAWDGSAEDAVSAADCRSDSEQAGEGSDDYLGHLDGTGTERGRCM